MKNTIGTLKVSAEAGDPIAQFQLGQHYEFGESGIQKDHKQAFRWYGMAADQGLATAQYALGLLYEHGRGTEKDYAKAREFYEKAADCGDPWAQNNLGFLYSHGKGVDQDTEKAMEWYRKAAAQGHFQAQFNIAARYAGGQGVEVDLAEAYFWFSRAQLGATALNTARSKEALKQLEEHMSPEELEEAKKRVQDLIGSN